MARLSVRKKLVFTLLLILALCFQSNMFSFAVEETEPTTETTTVKEAWAIETENMTVNLNEKDPLYVEAKTTEDGSVLSYESSDSSIAAINSETGKLTLKKAGSVTIHVTQQKTICMQKQRLMQRSQCTNWMHQRSIK